MLIEPSIDVILGFLLGVAFCLGVAVIGKCIRLLLDIRATRAATAALLGEPSSDPQLIEAREKVDACKKRLRFQKNPNPEWIAPLVDEIPKLIKEIASIYYPQASDPVRAPGLSQFARAIHLTTLDLSNFLQTRRIGRLVDVSANTALKTFQIGQGIVEHKHIKKLKWGYTILQPIYKKVRPVWQVVKYKSPFMWFGLIATNVAIRTLQPAVVDMVASRAIELYSGQLLPEADHSFHLANTG